MAFTPISEFTHKIQDLGEQPNFEQGFDYMAVLNRLQLPSDELRADLIKLIQELQQTTAGSSGAGNIGIEETIPGSGTTVKARVEWLYARIVAVILGQIPLGSLTDDYLSNLPGNIKSVLAALIEDYDEHKADNTAHGVGNKLDKTDYIRAGAYAVTSGTATAYTITLNPAPTAYADGQQFIILPHVDCGANPTLNVNNLGAGAILKLDGTAPAAGEIKANKPLSLVRVGSSFFIRSTGGGSNVKSVQGGIATVGAQSVDVTINAIDPSKSIILISVPIPGNSGTQYSMIQGSIKNATTITLKRGATDTYYPGTVWWQVIEFKDIKSLQSGTLIQTNTSSEQTVAINTINPSKSFIVASSLCPDDNTAQVAHGMSNVRIASATSLAFRSTLYNRQYCWYVVEFN